MSTETLFRQISFLPFQQVFWLSGYGSGKPSHRIFNSSAVVGFRHFPAPSPITAAGPPRIYTVFRDAETQLEY